LCKGSELAAVTHVQRQRSCLHAQRFDLLHHSLRFIGVTSVGKYNMCAARGQFQGCIPSQTAVSAGNQRNFVIHNSLLLQK